MRLLTTFPDEAPARRLADHLLTLGVRTTLNPEPQGWALWVQDEDRLVKAREELEAFNREPEHPRYVQAAPQAQAIRHRQVTAERQYEGKVIDARTLWSRPHPRSCVITVALIVLSGAATAVTRFGDTSSNIRQILSYAHYVIDGDSLWVPLDKLQTLKSPQLWRHITPIFLHFNFLHILFNMMLLYDFGGRIESYRGWWRFLLLVVFSAAISNFAQNLVSGPLFGGMSGVDYALFGFLWMKTKFDPQPGLVLPRETVLMALIWLVICLTGMMGNIANTAHFVGLGVGVLAGGARPAWRWAWRGARRWR